MREAIGVVNENIARVDVCLKAEGSASGHFRDAAGTRRPFDFRAVLLVIPPRHFYLTLQSGLGTREALMGSNEKEYWLHIEQDGDTYRYGTHEALADMPEADLPLRPDLVLEALGLQRLPLRTAGTTGPIQRIADDRQELIFLRYSDRGQALIEKEYWLSRLDPRLVERIVFRDDQGDMVMDSRLEDYKPLESGGPLLPHHIRIDWPTSDGAMDFRVSTWSEAPDRDRDHAAFVAPHRRDARFDRMIDLDRELADE